MTMTEEKKIRFLIALNQRTKPSNVYVEKEELLTDNKRKVYAKVKHYRVGVTLDGERITESWRVI